MIESLLATLPLAVVVVGVAMLALGLGQLVGSEPLQGSCGRTCESCPGRAKPCPRNPGPLHASSRREET